MSIKLDCAAVNEQKSSNVMLFVPKRHEGEKSTTLMKL